jgi:hypothetical protein
VGLLKCQLQKGPFVGTLLAGATPSPSVARAMPLFTGVCCLFSRRFSKDERVAMEGEIIRKCLGRSERQCSFIQYQNYKGKALVGGLFWVSDLWQ